MQRVLIFVVFIPVFSYTIVEDGKYQGKNQQDFSYKILYKDFDTIKASACGVTFDKKAMIKSAETEINSLKVEIVLRYGIAFIASGCLVYMANQFLARPNLVRLLGTGVGIAAVTSSIYGIDYFCDQKVRNQEICDWLKQTCAK